MDGLVKGIEHQAKQNEYFRRVLVTGEHTQVVIMSIPAGGEIGLEAHPDNDQVLYLVEGSGKVILNGQESAFKAGDLVLVKAGVKHNFLTVGETPMKIITTYSPPHHPAGTVHKTKVEADQAE
jgi:mannose-6-phosphate isomerase-like protein (cupin superfamily)